MPVHVVFQLFHFIPFDVHLNYTYISLNFIDEDQNIKTIPSIYFMTRMLRYDAYVVQDEAKFLEAVNTDQGCVGIPAYFINAFP